LYTAQKSNSHYAPQPYTNQGVFKSPLNCTSEMCRNATGREFQRHGEGDDSLIHWSTMLCVDTTGVQSC